MSWNRSRGAKLFYLAGSVLMLAVIGLAMVNDVAAALAATFTGRWKTNYGSMTLRQDNDGNVTGQYKNGSVIGDINGQVSGRVLIGTWTENSAHGDLKFTITADGYSFNGSWNRKSGEGEPGGVWNGTRQ